MIGIGEKGLCRGLRGALAVAVAAVALPLVFVGGASASVTGANSEFHCPLTPEFTNPANVSYCLHSETVGGLFAIGGLAVPISVPVAVDLFIETRERDEEPGEFYSTMPIRNLASGQILGAAAQNVPGGLLGIVGSPISGQSSKVTASIEAVGSHTPGGVIAPLAQAALSSENLINQEGTVFLVPLRVHLHNAFLGPECFIGSAASPIELRLTTGTTSPPPPARPIRGFGGYLNFQHEFLTILVPGAVLVGNSFSVPVANGCGSSQTVLGHSTGGVLDGAINHKLGLPSPAGRNTAILDTNIELNFFSLFLG
jgi:hypothetical protein